MTPKRLDISRTFCLRARVHACESRLGNAMTCIISVEPALNVETSEDAAITCSTIQTHTSQQQQTKMDVEKQAETEYSNHLEVSQGVAADDTAEGGDAVDTAETNKRLPLGQYLRSGDFKEICCCILFGILCMLTQYPGTLYRVWGLDVFFLASCGG